MKRILKLALAGIMATGLAAGTASAAENSLQEGAMGFSVGIVEDSYQISGRYFVYNDLAVVGGFGLSVQGGDRDASDFGIYGGARRYLNNDAFSFFLGGKASYTIHSEEGDEEDSNLFRVEGILGAEYFFNDRFSIEGGVGAGLELGQVANDSVYSLGTFSRSLAANFYF